MMAGISTGAMLYCRTRISMVEASALFQIPHKGDCAFLSREDESGCSAYMLIVY